MTDNPINQIVVSLLKAAGVSAPVCDKYANDMNHAQDNLEVLGAYWVQRICNRQIYTREVTDVCMLLIDTKSKMLWIDCFKKHVIPLIVTYHIME